MSERILIYGSYGYTGELIVELAMAAGLLPVLAGRTQEKVEAQSKATGLPHRCFALDNLDEVVRGLESVDAVIHCAGPFSRTAVPMAEGCIASRTHYLDITGEIEVFEALAAMSSDAVDAEVMLMPGAGFDVVPTDCLAAHLKRKLPMATELTLAFQGVGRPSRGTATTMVENIHKGGMIRRDGELQAVPSAWKSRTIDFGEGPAETITIPWGDVSTAYHSTGIPNITVYMAAPPDLRRMAKLNRYLGWFFGLGPVQGLLKAQIQRGPAGPSEEERKSGYSLVWGEARDDEGNVAAARMRTPEGYSLTAETALEIGRRAAAGGVPHGFATPSMAFGPDFILEFDGVERVELSESTV